MLVLRQISITLLKLHFYSETTSSCNVTNATTQTQFLKKLDEFIICCNKYFFANYTLHRRHSQRTHTQPYEHARTPYSYEHLQRLSRQILKIDVVTTSASLSTGTSPITEITKAIKGVFGRANSRAADSWSSTME
jgi:hypothetical protein